MGHTSRLRRRLSVLTAGLMVGWTVLLLAFLLWEHRLMDDQTTALARFHAAGAYERDLVYRAWNAKMGGVYAPITHIEPNPYLEVEDRDINSDIGPLTLVNPSYMTRIVHEIAAKQTGVVSHITSLDPIRPQNAPLPWEREALESFEAGSRDYYNRTATVEGEPVVQFMRPLVVTEECMKCHGKQGYVVGDVRGGISVTVPLDPIEAIQAPTRVFGVGFYLAAWVLGLAGIGLSGRSMIRMVGQLEDARASAMSARRRAEDSDKAKSRFLATMSHELRTPLNAILGFSQMMEHRVLGPLGNPTYEEYAQDIRVSGEHLLSLVNDVLDLSKIEAGRMTMSEKRVALAEIISKVVVLLTSEANSRGIRLESSLPDDAPAILADPRLVQQMLINIIANALRFTPEGGRIVIAVAREPDGACRVSVADTGQGIPPSEIQAVLEPFHQGTNVEADALFPGAVRDQKAARTGTGLGLALVKGFIEMHGGRLTLDSTVGQGTTVSLLFPAGRVLSPDAAEGASS